MSYKLKPIEVIDPLTARKKILSPKEQEKLLEKGIYLNQKSSNQLSPQRKNNGR